MSKLSKIRCAISIVGLIFVALSCYADDPDYTGEMPPVQIGDSCEESHPGYTWTISTRTEWANWQLCAAPDSYQSPDDWTQKDQFLSSMAGVLNGETTSEAFSNACVQIWEQFLSGDVELFVKFQRTITIETKAIRCINSIWTLENDSSVEQADQSQWLIIGTSGFTIGTTTAPQIEGALDIYRAELNSQPGADTTPDHSYTSP